MGEKRSFVEVVEYILEVWGERLPAQTRVFLDDQLGYAMFSAPELGRGYWGDTGRILRDDLAGLKDQDWVIELAKYWRNE